MPGNTHLRLLRIEPFLLRQHNLHVYSICGLAFAQEHTAFSQSSHLHPSRQVLLSEHGPWQGLRRLTLSKMKGRTVRRATLTVRHCSPMISSTRTCLRFDSPSDRAVATLEPGCRMLKFLLSSSSGSCDLQGPAPQTHSTACKIVSEVIAGMLKFLLSSSSNVYPKQ